MKNLRVLIDATCISRKKAGVGVYAINLVKELRNLDHGLEIFLLIQSDDPELSFQSSRGFNTIIVPSRWLRKHLIRLIFEQMMLPLILLRHRIDVLHSLHYSFPIFHPSVRQVVTIHDLTSFRMPEVHLRLKVWYFRFFIRAAVRCADYLIFVSRSALQDCEAIFNHRIPDSCVIHLGKSELFTAHPDPARKSEVQTRLHLPDKYILYVGTIEPRKNLARLVKSFAVLSKKFPDYHLVLGGMKGWMYDDLFAQLELLDDRAKIMFTGFIDEADKPYVIAGASVFVYPSLYEGFGIPVLEALACGVPTLTSNVASLPEVTGTAAVLVDPTSTEDITNGLHRLLSLPDLRSELRIRSLLRAAEFSWTKTAIQTVEAYRRALA